MYISFVLPHRFLAGKCHKFNPEVDEFGAGEMPLLLDLMEQRLEEIVSDPINFVDKEFMMSVFDTIKLNSPSFDEYMKYLLENKKSKNWDGTEEFVRMKQFVDELFDPQDETNQHTTELTIEFGTVAAKAWLDEFRKTGSGKNTYKYLRSADGESAYDKFEKEELDKFIWKQATNNPSEEGWGIASGEYFGKTTILGGNTAAIAMAKYNKPFHIDHKYPQNNGWFHQLPYELQRALLAMAIHLWKLVRLEERRKISLQSEYKRIEREQKFNAKILAASEKYMKRVVFLYKYKSGCRWTTGAQARSIFHSLSSDTKKLEAVKDQILMRTLGCGWKHLYPQWQVDNRKRTADELLEHLITVVMEYENSAKAIVLPSVSVKFVSR